MKRSITHIFLGDQLEFLSRKFILRIVGTSALAHRFVIFADKKSWTAWNDFFIDIGVTENHFLLLRTYTSKRLWFTLCRIYDMFRILLFSSAHILSHRRHYNLFLLVMLKLCGKRISFVCWGDIPEMKHGIRRLFQLFRSKCYTVGIVQISSEEIFFKRVFPSLKIITIPYLRDNTRVLEWVSRSSKSNDKCLLVGNSPWHCDRYSEILCDLDWSTWDTVVCMVQGDACKEVSDAFCKMAKELYGKKLLLWKDNVSFDKYLERIGRCSIYIYPGETQRGIDLTYNMLLMGKRVVCRGVNYQWLRSIGCIVDNLDKFNLSQCVIGY